MAYSWRTEVEGAIAAWPRVSTDQTIAHVSAAIAAGASAVHARDLALAFAVSRADPVATRQFEAEVGSALEASVRSIDPDSGFVDEVCQRARVHLVVGENGEPPRVANYRGAGPLRAWVAIAARRTALNAKREARPEISADSDDVLADLVDREPDAELRHLKALYRAEFREALKASLASLSDRSRAVLRLRFAEGLELAHLGRLYSVHESTASRWVSAALEEVATGSRAQLMARLSVTSATAESVTRMVNSGLDLSIATLLR